MTCSYCGARNDDGEQRCHRCGRRPGDVLSVGALAAKPAPAPLAGERAVLAPDTRRLASTPNLARAQQRSLFQERSDSNVIPFESYAPDSQVAPRRAKTAVRAAAKTAPRRPRISADQGTLDFMPALPPAPRKLGTTVDAVIVCAAPVATPLHRAVAAALDWSLVLIGYGLFLAGYFLTGDFFGGAAFRFDRLNFAVFGGALVLIAFTYGLMFAIAGCETAGMKWAHLRLVTFDGFKPEGRQRVYRFVGSCLSLCTVLGLAWSLADEESLGWQDHISRTFPTPREVETLAFRPR